MRFIQVDAHSFGPFKGESLEFGSGMNVLSGPNESGKSSWLAALFAALCGRKRGRGRGGEADEKFERRHRPWGTDQWSAGCTIELEDGRTIDLNHELIDRVDCHVIDSTTGQDLSSDLVFEGAPDGARLLGLNRNIVRSVLFVEQAALLSVLEDADNLQEHMQLAAGSGDGDATARRAIEALKKYLKEQIGNTRSPKKPLMMTTRGVEEARTELHEALGHVEGFFDLVVRREGEDAKVAETEERLSERRRLRDHLALAVIDSRLEEIRPLAEEFEAGPPPEPTDRDRDIQTVDRVLTVWDTRPAKPPAPPGLSVSEIEAEIDGLPDAPEGDLEPAPEIESAHTDCRDARRDLERFGAFEEQGGPDPVVTGSDPTELRDLAAELERGTRSPTPTKRRGSPVLIGGAGVLGALAGIVLLVGGMAVPGIVALAFGLAAGVAGLMLHIVRGEMQRPRSGEPVAGWVRHRLDTLGIPEDPVEIRRLAMQLERSQGKEAEREQWEGRRRGLAARIDERTADLVALLEGRGAAVETGNPEESYRRYSDECGSRRIQAAKAAKREEMQKQLEIRRRLEDEHENDRKAILEAEKGVLETVADLKLGDCDDPTEAASGLRSWREKEQVAHKERLETWTRYQKAQALLDGRTADDWEKDRRRLAEKVGEGDVVLDGIGADELEAEITALKLRLRAESTARDQLIGEVNAIESELPDVAALEEELERRQDKLAALQSSARILGKTVDFLGEAEKTVHRTIAPRLQAAIQGRLSAITGGRYSEVTVDPTELTIKVRTGDGQWRLATGLSHGTTEQIYLLLRVALAEHLVVDGESAPLILDDVTVQSDAERTLAILELLHDLSADRQIIFFSQEQEVIDWAEATLDGERDQLISLMVRSV